MYIQLLDGVENMASKTTRLFFSGNSQVVSIPREFQMKGEEVEIRRGGKTLVLTPKKRSWTQLAESLKKFTPDFMEKGRKQPSMRPF
jgi:antitoxin VapB